MAPIFKLTLVLCLVAACLGGSSTAPSETSPAPGGRSTAPSETSPAPGGSSTAPSETSPAPGGSSTAPSETSPAPGGSSTAPSETSPAPGGSSTAPSETSPAPGGSSTAPSETSPAPGGSSTAPSETSPAPGGSSTAPSETSPAPGGSSTAPSETSPAPGGSSTAPSETSPAPGGSSTISPPATTTTPPDPCTPNPCGRGSTCEARGEDQFVCLCLPGDRYNTESSSCERARVFPGDVTFPSVNFTDKLENKQSEEFLNATNTVTAELFDIFKNSSLNYNGSTVLEFRSSQAQRFLKNENAAVASVQLFFDIDSKVTSAEVDKTLEASEVLEFTARSLCSDTPCDIATTECVDVEGEFTCNCLPGFSKSNFTERVCRACTSGQQLVDDKCVACSFGYSGINCSESWQLILVIVGSVLGGLLLITLILLPILTNKAKKKGSGTYRDGPGLTNTAPYSAKTPLVNNSMATSQNMSGGDFSGIPRIPRATATNGFDRNTNLEMSQSRQQTSGHLYDQDDILPYGQSRSHNNPYASKQGLTNPYYRHDDGRQYS